jgi:hypothetical protein
MEATPCRVRKSVEGNDPEGREGKETTRCLQHRTPVRFRVSALQCGQRGHAGLRDRGLHPGPRVCTDCADNPATRCRRAVVEAVIPMIGEVSMASGEVSENLSIRAPSSLISQCFSIVYGLDEHGPYAPGFQKSVQETATTPRGERPPDVAVRPPARTMKRPPGGCIVPDRIRFRPPRPAQRDRIQPGKARTSFGILRPSSARQCPHPMRTGCPDATSGSPRPG